MRHVVTRIMERCMHEGCTNQARRGGVCIRHGAKQTLCSDDGCTNRAPRLIATHKMNLLHVDQNTMRLLQPKAYLTSVYL